MYTEARSVAGMIRVGVFAAPDVSTRNRLPRRVCRRRDPQYCCGSVSTGVTVYSRRVSDSPARAGRAGRAARSIRGYGARYPNPGTVAYARSIRGYPNRQPGARVCRMLRVETHTARRRVARLYVVLSGTIILYTVGVSVTRLMRVDPLNGFGGRRAPAAPTCGSRDVRRACAPALSVRPPHFGLYLPSAWNRK